MNLRFGDTPVPVTASWSGEDRFFLAQCKYANTSAICQNEVQGVGKPVFNKPHANRQRAVIAKKLCDLCGKSLKTSTKVSLSHARPQPHGANGWAILQVEPLLHVQCAATCLKYCPSLKRDLDAGTLMIRHVTSHRVQFAIMTGEYIETLTGINKKAVGHAKVELLKWHDKDKDWLLEKAGLLTMRKGKRDGE
jgi:hypothetical protein